MSYNIEVRVSKKFRGFYPNSVGTIALFGEIVRHRREIAEVTSGAAVRRKKRMIVKKCAATNNEMSRNNPAVLSKMASKLMYMQ
jgi:hypothetical protein